MLSLLESSLLTDFLGSDNLINEEPKPNFGGSFSPPSVALNNVLSTPQLTVSESYNSPDYNQHQINAQNGFNPEESIHTQKFKLPSE